jgi:hypothetical protein
MSNKSTNMRVLLDDLKVSFKFAVKNLISFILGMIGVLIVSVVVLAIVAIFVVAVIFLTGGFEAFVAAIVAWSETAETMQGATAFIMIFLIVTPIIAPLMVAIGALFGMAREIVESEGTSAEGVFAWYSKKFFSLAGAGILLFLIVIAPIATVSLLFGPFSIAYGDIWTPALLFAGVAIYAGLVSGFLSLTFPAVIDGRSALQAIRTSLRLSTKYFDRVFSVWFSFLGIALVVSLPTIIPPLVAFPGGIGEITALASYSGYALLVTLFDLFILLPAIAIGMSRIYLILVSENLSDSDEYAQQTSDGNSFIGGD